jgi:hypothetical protein
MSLPLIDISGFLDPSSTPETLQTIADKIHAACQTTGFFYLSGHGVTAEEGAQILRTTRAFLVDGTRAEKERLSIARNDHARGYQRIGDNVTGGKSDWHEALDLYAPSPFPSHLAPIEHNLLAGQNRFPAHPPDFQPVVENWIRRMCELGLVVMRATAMGLKMSLSETEQLLDQVRNSFWSIEQSLRIPSTLSREQLVSDLRHWQSFLSISLGSCVVLVIPPYHPPMMVFLVEHIKVCCSTLISIYIFLSGMSEMENLDCLVNAQITAVSHFCMRIQRKDRYKSTCPKPKQLMMNRNQSIIGSRPTRSKALSVI